jgi:uncharacterized membrane protein YjgN (DUF898 family)
MAGDSQGPPGGLMPRQDQDGKYTGFFHGKGLDLFLITFVNQLLTLVTLGIWHAWAKARVYKYLISHMEFAGHRLRFVASGWQIFKGFLRAAVVVAGLYLLLAVGGSHFTALIENGEVLWGAAGIFVVYGLFFAGFLVFTEFAWFASRRFKSHNTSYREIRFWLDDRPSDFLQAMLGWRLAGTLTFILLPVYYFTRMQRLYSRLRYGDLRFSFDGRLGDYFVLNLRGFCLTLITLGIYSGWWLADLQRFRYNHLNLDGSRFSLDIKTGEYISLLAGNFFIILFTLGLGLAWAKVRTQRFFLNRLSLYGPLDLNAVVQRRLDQGNAIGEGLEEFFEMDMGIGF